MIKRICILLIMSICFSGVAFGEDLIQPFGKLTWEDGLFDVITTLSNRKDLEKIVFSEYPDEDIKGINKIRLIEILGNLIDKKYGEVLIQRGKTGFEKTYKINRKEKKYIPNRLIGNIEAYPVFIVGIPMKIIVNFSAEPGVEVRFPDKVLTEKRWDYSFPLLLTEVKLLSNSPLIKDNYKKLNKIIVEKYKKYDKKNTEDIANNTFTVSDEDKTTFSVSYGDSYYSFSYKAEANLIKFAKIYRLHCANLERKRTKYKQYDGREISEHAH